MLPEKFKTSVHEKMKEGGEVFEMLVGIWLSEFV